MVEAGKFGWALSESGFSCLALRQVSKLGSGEGKDGGYQRVVRQKIWQDGGRWADSYTVGLFSPAEKVHRSCQISWDVPWAAGGGSGMGVRDWQLLLNERDTGTGGKPGPAQSARRGAGSSGEMGWARRWMRWALWGEARV